MTAEQIREKQRLLYGEDPLISGNCDDGQHGRYLLELVAQLAEIKELLLRQIVVKP